MTTTLETIVLGLLLVVLLSYRRGFRASLGIRNLHLPMWCPEPTLTCISYSTTCPRSFTWMTCVSLSAEEEELPHLRLLLPLLLLLLLHRRLLLHRDQPRRQEVRLLQGRGQLRRRGRRPCFPSDQ